MYRTLFGLMAFCLPVGCWAAGVLPVAPEQRQAMGIESAPVTPASTTGGLEVTGKVVLPPASVRVVAAPVDGLVTALMHQAGEPVKAGTRLASLSSPEIVEAQRQYVQARLKHQLAADNASRDQRLADQRLIAQNTWLLTQNEVKLAKADLEAAEATLRLLGVKPGSDTSETLLTSPIDGWVIETLVEPGQRVEAPAPLVKVGNLYQLGLEIPLTPAQAQHVSSGQLVEVAEGKVSGTVRALQPALDMAQNVIVRADIRQVDNTLHPGQNVKVVIQASNNSDATASVPASAVVWSGDQAHVFVETPEGFQPTPVSIATQTGTLVNVGGLAADNRVATQGVAALKAKWLEAGE